MVFESTVIGILNKYLGKYIEKLDESNLSVSVWRGDAVLEDLELKKDALSQLDLPIEVNWGYIGKLTLQIPWSSLYTKPVIIVLQDVYILAAPAAEKPYNEQREIAVALRAKRRHLRQIEKAQRKKNNEPKPTDKSSTDSFTEKLTAQIVKNVQVTIDNVHIRYEDRVTQPNAQFAAGITLANISAQTTDKSGKPIVVDASAKRIHKLLKLEHLSFYWNTGSTGSFLFHGQKDLKNLMKSSVQTSTNRASSHEYILEPLSASATVSIDQASNVIENLPKVLVNVLQKALCISLSSCQFKGIMNIIDSFQMMITNQPYRRYKPSRPLLEDPRAWWRYAFTCLAETKIRAWSWPRIKKHREVYREYKNSWRRRLIEKWRGVSDTSTLDFNIKVLESKLDIPNILIARQQAENEYLQYIDDVGSSSDSDDEKKVEEKDSGWWRWLGFGNRTSEAEITKEDDSEEQDLLDSLSLSALSDEEKNKLYEAIGYSEEVGNPVYPKAYVKSRLEFRLSKCQVDLLNDCRREILTLSLSELVLGFSQRPGSNGFSIEMSVANLAVLGSPEVSGSVQELTKKRPWIVSTDEKKKDHKAEYRLFNFVFATNPVEIKTDFEMTFQLRPLQATYNMQTVKALQSFFQMPETEAMIELEQAASARIYEFTKATRAGVEYAILHNRSTFMNVDINSPHLVVPYNEVFEGAQNAGKVLTVDLGDLSIKTDLQAGLHHDLLSEATESDLESMFYNKTDITLSNISIAIRSGDSSSVAQTWDYLLPPMIIALELSRSLKAGYANFPDFKVVSEMKTLTVNLSEEKVEELIKFVSYLGTWQYTQPVSQENAGTSTSPSRLTRTSLPTLSMTELEDLRDRLAENSKRAVSPQRSSSPDAHSDTTHDDSNWFDAEEDVRDGALREGIHHRSSEAHSSEISLYDRTKASFKIAVGQLSIKYFRKDGGLEQLYLWLNVQSCDINLEVHVRDQEVSCKIGAIHFTDLIHKDFHGNPLRLLDSPPDVDFITVNYVMADSNGPEFCSRFRHVEQSINIVFSRILILGKEDSLLGFFELVSNILRMLNDNPIYGSTEASLPVCGEENFAGEGKIAQSYLESVNKVARVNVEICIMIDDLTFLLASQTALVMKASMTGFDLEFSHRVKKTEVTVRQRTIEICDLQNEEETKILSVASSDRDVLFVKLVIDNFMRRISSGRGELPDINTRDMELVTKLSKMQFIFLYSMFEACKNILFALTEDSTRRDAQEVAAHTLQNEVTAIHEQSRRIGLDIDIAAPAIFIPVRRGSRAGFAVDLGHIKIANSFKYKNTSTEGETVLFDCIEVSLKDFIVHSSLSNCYAKLIKQAPINAEVKIERSLCPSCNSVPVADIEICVPVLKIGLGEKDISLFFEVMAENFGERANEEVEDAFFDAAVTLEDLKEESPLPLESSAVTAESGLQARQDNKSVTSLVTAVDYKDQSVKERSFLLAKCSVRINEIILLLCEKLEDPCVYLSFEAENMNALVEHYTSETIISSAWKSVSLQDHSGQGSPLNMLSSLSGKDLMAISLTLGHHLDPVTQLVVPNQVLDILSSGWLVNLEKSSLAKLASFLQHIGEEATQLTNRFAESNRLPTEEEKENSAEEQRKSLFRVTASMEQVTVTFLEDQSKIASTSIEGLAARIAISEDKTSVICRLRSIDVTELRGGSIYPQVVTVEDDNMLSVEFTMLSEEKKARLRQRQTDSIVEDGTLKVLVGRVKAVFVYKVMADIVKFFDPLVNVLVGSNDGSRSTLKQQISQLNAAAAAQYAQSSFKLALDLDIHAPLILVPKTSLSCDVLIFDMGNLRLWNRFGYSTGTSELPEISIVKDTIRATLRSAMVARGRMDRASGIIAEVPVLDKVDIAATMNRFLLPNTPELNFTVELPEVKVSVTESDLNLLAFAFPVNMAEGQLSSPVSVGSTDGLETTIATNEQAIEVLVTITCNLAKVDFIMDGNAEDEVLRSGSKPLCSLAAENLSVKVKVERDYTVLVDVDVCSLSGEDTRPSNDSFYKEVLKQREAPALVEEGKEISRSVVVAKYKGLPSWEQFLDLEVQRIIFLLNLKFVMELVQFFTVGFAHEEPDAQEWAATKGGEQLDFVVTGEVRETDLYLLENSLLPETNAIVANVDANIFYKLLGATTQANLDVRSLGLVYAQLPDVVETGRQLLKPCELKLMYHFPVKESTGQAITIAFTEMKCSLSPSLLSTILQIIETVFGNQVISKEKMHRGEDAIADSLWDAKSLHLSTFDGQEDFPVPPVVSRLSSGDQLDIHIALLELVLGNDMKGMVVPLITTKMSLKSRINDWTSLVRVEFDLSIEASYFNDARGTWEPLLEPTITGSEIQPFEIMVKLLTTDAQKMIFQADEKSKTSRKRVFSTDVDTTDGQAETGLATYIIVNSIDTMQLTVTPKVIDIVQELIQGWNMESLREAKDTKLQSPLHIENQLGLPATVWVRRDTQVSGHDGKMLFIRYYAPSSESSTKQRRVTDSASFDHQSSHAILAKERAVSFSGVALTKQQLSAVERKLSPTDDDFQVWSHCGEHIDCISVLVKGFKPVRHVDIHAADKKLLPLMPEKSFFVTYMICEVDLQLGRKSVLLRSSLQVINALRIPLQIWHVDVSSAEPEGREELEESDKTSVEPGATLNFPLDRIFETYFFIQPEGYEKSSRYVTWRRLKDKEHVQLQCLPADKKNGLSHFLTLYSSFDKFDAEPPDFVPRHIIEVLPPLRVHNFLTTSLKVTFKSDDTEYTETFGAGLVSKVVHFRCVADISLALEILDYKGQNWTGETRVSLAEERVVVPVTFRSTEPGSDVELTVEMIQTYEKSLDLVMYSAFWILNKTEIPLEAKVSGKNQIHLLGAQDSSPLLISYGDASKTKVALRVKRGQWTKLFSLSAVGDESSVVCRDADLYCYEIHVNIQLSKTGMTKIVTCSPKYVMKNETKLELSFLERDSPHSLWRMIKPESCCPLWPQTTKKIMHLKPSSDLSNTQPIPFGHNRRAVLRMFKPFTGLSTAQFFPFGYSHRAVLRLSYDTTVGLQVSCVGSRVLILIRDYEVGMAPVRVENYTSMPLQIQQKNVGQMTVVDSLSSLLYTWDDLVKPRALLWKLADMKDNWQTAEISVDGLGKVKYRSFVSESRKRGVRESTTMCGDWFCSSCRTRRRVPDSENRRLLDTARDQTSQEVNCMQRIYWVSHLDGGQRVFSLTNDLRIAKKLRKIADEEELVFDVFISLRGVGISLVNSIPREILYMSLASGTSVWEVETSPGTLHVLDGDISQILEAAWKSSVYDTILENGIQVDLRTMVMEKPLRGKLKRTCDPGVWVRYSISRNSTSLHVKLNRLQVDNQQHNVVYLTSLYPTPLPQRVIQRTGLKPFLEFSMITAAVGEIMVIKYLKLLVQEFNLKVDKALLMGIIGFYFKAPTESDELTSYQDDCKLIQSGLMESLGNVRSYSPPMVIEFFHLSPIKMHLAFSLQGGSMEKSPESVILEWLIDTIGVQFTDVSDAEIKLAFFQRQSVRLTQEELTSDCIRHYWLQAIKQFHVIVLGLDVLGNPYGLVTDIGQGFRDFFYEPYRGVVNGPQEFAEGLAYGVKSLLGHTIGGTFNAASKITGQLGQALDALSFDPDYRRRRRARMRSDYSGIGEGLVVGSKNFVMGVVYGISGLFTKPVEGARRGGIEGFFTGIGKGLVGVLVKPTGGAIDLITCTFDGVRRFAEQRGEDNPCRLRLPRLTYPNEVLEPFSKFKAEGFGLLRMIDRKDKYAEKYKYHLFVMDEDDNKGEVVILTDRRMLKAYKNRFFEEWKICWSDLYEGMEVVTKEARTVHIRVKEEDSDSEEDSTRRVHCQTERQAEILYDKLIMLTRDSG